MPIKRYNGSDWEVVAGAGAAGAPGTNGTNGTNGSSGAGVNKILNGNFSIWQRGTSFTPTAASVYFTADRFYTVVPAATSVTRQTFTPGTAPVAGYEGQFYMNTTITANAQNYEAGQRIENARTFAGETVTLSFWARSTVGAQALNVGLTQYFGSGGSPSAAANATLITGTSPYTPTSSWQRFTFTFTVPSVAGKTFGTNNDSFLYVKIFQYTATTTNTSLDIWGVQLEAGSVATTFQTATGNPASELAACQRYYREMNTQYGYICSGTSVNGTDTVFALPMPSPMRVNPTLTVSANSDFDLIGSATRNVTGFNSVGGKNNFAVYAFYTTVASGQTAGQSAMLFPDGANARFILSAEL